MVQIVGARPQHVVFQQRENNMPEWLCMAGPIIPFLIMSAVMFTVLKTVLIPAAKAKAESAGPTLLLGGRVTKEFGVIGQRRISGWLGVWYTETVSLFAHEKDGESNLAIVVTGESAMGFGQQVIDLGAQGRTRLRTILAELKDESVSV